MMAGKNPNLPYHTALLRAYAERNGYRVERAEYDEGDGLWKVTLGPTDRPAPLYYYIREPRVVDAARAIRELNSE
jgi:hypothetical protein